MKRETNLQTWFVQDLSLPTRLTLLRQWHFKVHSGFRFSFCREPQNSGGKHDSDPSQGDCALILRYPVQCLLHSFVVLFFEYLEQGIVMKARQDEAGSRERRSSVRAPNCIISQTTSRRHNQRKIYTMRRLRYKIPRENSHTSNGYQKIYIIQVAS